LVYYYFRTMDELFLAVFRRGAEASLKRLEEAEQEADPLRAIWEVSSRATDSTLTVEFIALANHRPALRAELAASTREFRSRQREIAERFGGVRAEGGPSPEGEVLLIAALARILAMDGMLDISEGHDEMAALVESYLTRARTSCSSDSA
jgi:AcrR family transcriptional regulator